MEQDKRELGFWKGRIRSFRFAGKGIKALFRHEHNAQFHLGAVVVVTIAGFFFGISSGEWCAVCLCFGLVTATECMNTALERLCDFVNPDFDKHIGDIKDLAAGAVLLATISAIVVGIIIFLPKFLAMLQSL